MRFQTKQPLLLIFLFLLYFGGTSAYSYLPNLKSYDKQDYQGGRQNWDIDIDSHGIVYFGNSDGLLYNVYGEWILKPISNNTAIRSVFVDNDTIWCGGEEFGFFSRDNGYDLSYHRVGDFNGGLTWDILNFQNKIYLRSEKLIKIINKKTQEIKTVPILSGAWAFTEWNDELWVMRHDGELGILSDTTFIRMNSFLPAKDNEVRKMFIHNQALYIILHDGRLFTFDGTHFEEIKLPSTLDKQRIFTGFSYNEDSYCLGTISNGFFQLSSKDHTVLKTVNADDGLIDNTVLSMKRDKSGNVWLGLDYGIAKLELRSAINTNFNKGATYFVKNKDAATYLATNKGVYYSSGANDFSLSKNSAGQVWRIKEMNGQLYACHNNGLIRLDKDKAEFVFRGAGELDAAQIE
nr:hypothetical protein [Bacteroidales bacterium]